MSDIERYRDRLDRMVAAIIIAQGNYTDLFGPAYPRDAPAILDEIDAMVAERFPKEPAP